MKVIECSLICFEETLCYLRKMLQSTNNGDRECHIIKVPKDDDVVKLDDDYPPPIGEEFTHCMCLSRRDARDKPRQTISTISPISHQ